MIIDTRKKRRRKKKIKPQPEDFNTILDWNKIGSYEYIESNLRFKIIRFRKASDFSINWRLEDLKRKYTFVYKTLWEAQLKADDIYVNGIFKKKSKK